jgi:hypothetical protein
LVLEASRHSETVVTNSTSASVTGPQGWCLATKRRSSSRLKRPAQSDSATSLSAVVMR